LRAIADAAAPQQNDIFFCLSCQRENGGARSKINAKSVRALWMDMDVDPNNPEKYPSIEEALADLFYFCQLLEIPPPSAVVSSGSGVHAYWISIDILTVDEWLPFANGLKNAAKSSTLKIDAGCTADVSRVLRVPDTWNYKYNPPQQVRLLQRYCNGIMHDFPTVLAKLLEFAPTGQPVEPITIAEEFEDSFDPNERLGAGLEFDKLPDMPLEPMLAECGWLKEAYDTGGEKFDNPQWNQTTLIATWLENGYELAHTFAKGHRTYTRAETDEKWEHKNRERGANPRIGWPKCETIKGLGSKHCEICPNWGKIKSPLNISLAVIKPILQEEHEDKALKLLGGSRPPELRLPEGFAVDNQNRICQFTPDHIAKDKLVPAKLTLVLRSQVSNPTFFLKDGKFGIALIVETEKDGKHEVYLSSDECLKAKVVQNLTAKFVLCNPEKGVEDMVQKLMISWLDKLRANKAERDPGTMGWRYVEGERVGFAYGSTLYHQDGKETAIVGAADDAFRSWYMPTGKREVWVKACKLLTDRKRPQLDCIIAIAFAAPLATFAGTLYGAILSIWGEPGTAKSTAQQVAASVYGHPKQTRESLNSTSKSVLSRLGRTRNLPAWWDDVQDERHLLALFDTLFIAAEGTEGGRLNPDASYKQRLEWQTLLVVCANASFVEYLLRKQKSTTAGIRRVFEIEFNKLEHEPGLINPVIACQAFGDLVHNYGVIGAEYAKVLATEHKQIGELVLHTMDRFRHMVEGSADEVYWWGMCGVLIVGAQMANRLGAEIDLAALEQFLIYAFDKNRLLRHSEGTEGGSYDNTERALTGFLNHHVGSGNVLFVDQMRDRRNVGVLLAPLQGRPIFIQVAKDDRLIVFSRRAIREYLFSQEIHSRQVFAGLDKFFGAKETKRTLGAGTAHAQTQETCFEIPVPEGKFEILEDLVCARGAAVQKFQAKVIELKT
jgi:Domain of unknown function (DUF927)